MRVFEFARATAHLSAAEFAERERSPFLLLEGLSSQTIDTVVAERAGSVQDVPFLRVCKSERNRFRDVITLGRGAENDIVFRDDRVSKFHAYLVVGEDDVSYVVDNESTNGTFLGGEALTPNERRRLGDGDLLRFGDRMAARFFTPAGFWNFLEYLRESEGERQRLAAKANLILLSGPEKGTSYRVGDGLLLGAGEGCDIACEVPDDEICEVSIERDARGFLVRTRLAAGAHEARLYHGDRVQVGLSVFQFSCLAARNPEATGVDLEVGFSPFVVAGGDPDTASFPVKIEKEFGSDEVVSLPREGEVGAERSRHFLHALYRVGKAVSFSPSLPILLESVSGALVAALEPDRFILLLKDDDGRTQELKAAFVRRGRDDPEGVRLPVDRPAVARAAADGVSTLTQRASESGGKRAVLCAAIAGNEGPLGAFYVEGEPGGEIYVHADLDFCASVGRILGLALERARLDERVHTHAQALERELLRRRRAEEERASLQLQVQHAQRLESLGVLAGGIAHDFNNILSPILGYAEMAAEKAPPDGTLARDLRQIVRGALRARELVEQILHFSRRSDEERRPIEARHLVREALELLRASLPAGIEIREELAREGGRVRADPSQLHQLVVNLCTNAAQAMGSAGVLEVRLRPVEFDEAAAARHPGLAPGAYVELLVRDTGSGIDEAIRARIFDPFFTTKKHSGGTGMGLAVVHGIVKRHEGAIQVESAPGAGTCVRVFLPRVVEESAAADGEEEEELAAGGDERVLLAEDNGDVRELCRRLLVELGYAVTAYGDPRAALEGLREAPAAVDLLLTDYDMPHLSGLVLAERALELRADLPVLLITGFGEELTEARVRGSGIRAVLTKPVTKVQLARALRAALDGGA